MGLERGAVGLLIIAKKFDRDKAKEFEALAESTGAELIMVSTDHHDGEQFWNLTNGVAAILRFSLE